MSCRAALLIAFAALVTTSSCTREPAANALNRPCNLDVGPDGQVAVSDFHNARVVIFDAQGVATRTVGSRGFGHNELWGVGAITLLPDGGFALVNRARASIDDLDTPRPEIKLFDAEGQERRTFSTLVGVDVTSLPTSVAAIPNGLAVSDIGHHRISIFSSDGLPERVIERVTGGPIISSPTSLRYRNDQLWLTEGKEHRVRALTLDGKQLLNVGREGSEDGQLLFPQAVDVSKEGWFVVADLGNYRLQRFSAEGEHLLTIVPTPIRPDIRVQLYDVVVGPDDLIYAVDAKGNRILVYQADGNLVRVIGG